MKNKITTFALLSVLTTAAASGASANINAGNLESGVEVPVLASVCGIGNEILAPVHYTENGGGQNTLSTNQAMSVATIEARRTSEVLLQSTGFLYKDGTEVAEITDVAYTRLTAKQSSGESITARDAELVDDGFKVALEAGDGDEITFSFAYDAVVPEAYLPESAGTSYTVRHTVSCVK